MSRCLKLICVVVLGASLPLFAQDDKPAAAASPAASPAKSAVKNVGAGEFDQLRRGTNVVVLDVRTPAEYAEGHLPGAVLVDYRAPDFTEKVAKLDKSKTYLVHCAAGVRSAKACTKMEGLGLTNLINLEGGVSAWKEAGKPLTK